MFSFCDDFSFFKSAPDKKSTSEDIDNFVEIDNGAERLELKDLNERYCYECDSDADPRCINQVDRLEMVKCPSRDEDFGCFHIVNGILRHFLFTI